MKNDKADGIIGMILKKKSGYKKEEEEKSPEDEDTESDSPKEAISQDLIDAVKAEDASAVTDALDAIYEAWNSSMPKTIKGESKEDCGCK